MLHDLSRITGLEIAASDESIGKSHDFYFDDRTWRIRYMVIDTGWLFGRKVLVSPETIIKGANNTGEISVSLNRQKIENAPDITTDLPVSLQEELTLHNYYGWTPYWEMHPRISVLEPLVPSLEIPGQGDRQDLEVEIAERRPGDVHLRSAREVDGYHIEALDGEIGHIDDFIVDEETWLIRYLVVDTRNWLPGRKVLLGIAWATGVDWSNRVVKMDLTKEAIREAPEYDSQQPINRQYEIVLHETLGFPGYWSRES